MKKLNNSGQSLVAFVLLIPILLLSFALVVDMGLMGVEKRKTTNVIKNVISYGLNNHSDSRELRELIDENIKYDTINIDVNDNMIRIALKYNYNSVFKFLGHKYTENRVVYVGKKAKDEIKIIKE